MFLLLSQRHRRYSPQQGSSLLQLRRSFSRYALKSRPTRGMITIFVVCCIVWSIISSILLIYYGYFFSSKCDISNISNINDLILSTGRNGIVLDKFVGPRWSNNIQTVSSETIIENKWVSLSRHNVRTHPNLDGQSIDSSKSSIIDDWLWIDTMNQINILVTTIIDKIEYFVIFEQTKYGYNGPSYAVVGGHIEMDDKSALIAARRELFEELGMIVDDSNWIEFNENEGYRTDVNRGLGFCHTFLARKGIFKDKKKHENLDFFDETEQLHIKYVTLHQLIEYFQKGLFKEAKWSNTVGLGLLYMLLADHNTTTSKN